MFVAKDTVSIESLSMISRVLKYFYFAAGVAIVLTALVSMLTNMPLEDLLSWVDRHFGVVFSVLYTLLVVIGAVCIAKLRTLGKQQSEKACNSYVHFQRALYAEIGVHCANGVSTLALTFTLLGISLGIGSLSSQSLAPENVESIIAALTAQFSMAFMTTVVGLPTAALLRAGIGISQVAGNRVTQQVSEHAQYASVAPVAASEQSKVL